MAIIEHTIGQPFNGRGYSLEDLTDTLRDTIANNSIMFFPATEIHMKELGMTIAEVERCLEHGKVVSFEVSPFGKNEIRLEVSYNSGDIAGLHPIIWLSSNYSLVCADVTPRRDA